MPTKYEVSITSESGYQVLINEECFGECPLEALKQLLTTLAPSDILEGDIITIKKSE